MSEHAGTESSLSWVRAEGPARPPCRFCIAMDLAGGTVEHAERDALGAPRIERQEGKDFATSSCEGYARSCRGQSTTMIRKVSEHWRLERMPRVDRNILRLSARTSSVHAETCRARVTLNEAVELAKRYGSEGSAGFVNGVLDRIATKPEQVGRRRMDVHFARSRSSEPRSAQDRGAVPAIFRRRATAARRRGADRLAAVRAHLGAARERSHAR